MGELILSSITEYDRYVFCTIDHSRTIVLLAFPAETDCGSAKQWLLHKSDHLRRQIQEATGFLVTAGISRVYSGLDRIYPLYQEAQSALQYKIYFGTDRSIDIEQVPPVSLSFQPEEAYYYGCISKIRNAVFSADKDTALTYLDEYFHHQKNTFDIYYMRRCTMLLLDALIQHAITLNVNLSAVTDKEHPMYSICQTMDTFQELKEYAAHIIQCLNQEVSVLSGQKYSRYIQAASEYISEHYQDPDLCLGSTANDIGISSSYLGKLFKKEFQENFVDYLNKFRVAKAKELLGQTMITVKEAGYMTGFNNAQNFIRIFKKYEGITPGQFQKQANIYSE